MVKKMLSNWVVVEVIHNLWTHSIVKVVWKKVNVIDAQAYEIDEYSEEDYFCIDWYYAADEEIYVSNTDLHESVVQLKKTKEFDSKIEEKKKELEALENEIERIKEFRKTIETSEDIRAFIDWKVERYYLDGKDIIRVWADFELAINRDWKLLVLKKCDNWSYNTRWWSLTWYFDSKEAAEQELEKREKSSALSNIKYYLESLEKIVVWWYDRNNRRMKISWLPKRIEKWRIDLETQNKFAVQVSRILKEEKEYFRLSFEKTKEQEGKFEENWLKTVFEK